MKLALLADIHANLEALTACLAHARRQGADGHVFLGDLVGYGADPGAVVDLVESHVRQGALVVRGNHDEAAVGRLTQTMNRDAEAAMVWTRGQLSAGQRAFLAGLPLLARRGEALFVHASAERPERWTYVTDPFTAAASLAAADVPYVFCGHVHEERLYQGVLPGRAAAFPMDPGVPTPVSRRGRWLVTVGSVGQTRGGTPCAHYALMDLPGECLTFFHVPYEHAIAAAKVRAAGLPERLAQRLEHGV